MVQKFIPEIKDGDKRIILIKGNPVPYALARIPVKGSFKGNLAQGASFEVRDLTPRDKYICAEIKDFLVSNGLDFVGIDVIGDYLSEINITSPTGVREIDRIKNISIAKDFIAAII
jgi:glutathione synthase